MFVHVSTVERAGMNDLNEGQKVEAGGDGLRLALKGLRGQRLRRQVPRSLGDHPFAPPPPTWREHLRSLGRSFDTREDI